MTQGIKSRYRINCGGGYLFVRELVLGEIVARILSDLKISSVEQQDEIIRLCSSAFVGPLESIEFNDDCFYVTCAIGRKDG